VRTGQIHFNGQFGLTNDAIKDPLSRARDRARNAGQFFTANNVRVMNISFDLDNVGLYKPPSKTAETFYDYLIGGNPNVTFVVAAGNGRNGSGNLQAEMQRLTQKMVGKYDNFVLVAATSSPGQLAKYSNAGSPLTSIAAFGNTPNVDRFGFRDDFTSGTSIAAPRVSATIVKILTFVPDLSARQIKTLIEASGTGPNSLVVGGILKLKQATNGGELQSDLAIQSAALIRQLNTQQAGSVRGLDEALSRAGLDKLSDLEKSRVLQVAQKVLGVLY
jgi:Subtilase family